MMAARGHSGSDETGDNEQFITTECRKHRIQSGSCTEVTPIMTLHLVEGKV